MQNSRPRHSSRLLGIAYFIHPLPLTAVFLLALNEIYLKAQFASFWTSKLSDFAGIFFFPIFLCALWNLFHSAADRLKGKQRLHWLSSIQLLVSIVLTDIVFAAIKLSPTIAGYCVDALGWLGLHAHVTYDPTDLTALSMTALTWLYAKGQMNNSYAERESELLFDVDIADKIALIETREN